MCTPGFVYLEALPRQACLDLSSFFLCRYGWQPNYYQNQPPQPPLPAPEALPPPPATVTQPQAQAPVAYTRVTPKTSMARTSGQEERKSGWPESLRSFTQRAFIGARTPEDKAQLQVFLKELINTTQKRGELWTRDWAAMPLPDCSRPLEDRMKESPHGSSSTRSAMSIIRPPSPFRMTFRHANFLQEITRMHCLL